MSNMYSDQEKRTMYFIEGVLSHSTSKKYKFNIYNAGSIFWLAFSDNIHIRKASEIDSESMTVFKKLHKALLERGVYLGPSGFEVGFISQAHTYEVLDQAIIKFNEALDHAFEED